MCGSSSMRAFLQRSAVAVQRIDETVEVGTDNGGDIFGGGSEGGGGLVTAQSIAEGQSKQYTDAFRRLDDVDGAMGVVRGPASVQNETKQLTEPLVVLMGVAPDELEGFESDFETLDGQRVSPADLAPGEIFANEPAAEDLDIDPGDTLEFTSDDIPLAKEAIATGIELLFAAAAVGS